jgi:hypothetical protein
MKILFFALLLLLSCSGSEKNTTEDSVLHSDGDVSSDAKEILPETSVVSDMKPDETDAESTNCCGKDKKCPVDKVCVGDNNEGTCEALPEKGKCWTKDDCGINEICFGVLTCPCNANCDSPPTPGVCVLPDEKCCFVKSECAENEVCVGAWGITGGRCLPEPASGKCYSDSDCTGVKCEGSVICSCGTNCPTIEGNCKNLAANCCTEDNHCPDKYHCVMLSKDPGVCKEPPPSGKCWEHADCPQKTACLGASMCPCNSVCGMIEAPGSCVSLPSTCCISDSDCSSGNVCVLKSDTGIPGSCKPDPDGPQCMGDYKCCWEDSDCGTGLCKDVSACPCIELCYTCGACAPDKMGACK